ncbi:hypothetical protein [Acidicapsa ligni]|uniref:hypothetical protein n=1 Tax=Acidicapsa ligni TaxID=542300 RepID=UPI0021E0C580|nr:hypothetical protein [Acidicapsa ligni]
MRFVRLTGYCLLVLGAVLSLGNVLHAQEKPYFVTYSTDLEEPGNLEVALKGLTAPPKDANAFVSPTIELEYGATAWWTTEVYAQGQATVNDSTVFTGFRWENRFRPLPREYFVTPAVYVEYESVSNADKSILEITGHDGISRFQVNNGQTHGIVEHSIEGKLILSSNFKGWNISENMIAEKNMSNEPWEFGYALGAARSLASAGSARRCYLCRQNFDAGAELYGGLGDRYSFGLKQTSQYAGPTVDFRVPNGPTVSFSPQFGLNDNSIGTLWRFKVSYEIQQIRDLFKSKDSR